MNPVSILPRFIRIKAEYSSLYLVLNSRGELLFDRVPDNLPSESPLPRLATHEVLYNADDNSFVIRSQNGRFWSHNRSGKYSELNATLERPPSATDSANRFKVEKLDGANVMALKSALEDGRYFKKYLNFYSGLPSRPASLEIPESRVEITSSQEYAINLPRYITFKGDNDKFMHLHYERYEKWLKFHGDSAGSRGTHEVIPLLDGKVAFRSLESNQLWRSTGGWVWADGGDSNINKSECKFQPIRLSSNKIALRNERDNRLAKRYTDYWEDCLATIENANLRDSTTHFQIAEAVSSRSVFDVHYLRSLADTSDMRPLVVGQGSATNNSSSKVDLEVQDSLEKDCSKPISTFTAPPAIFGMPTSKVVDTDWLKVNEFEKVLLVVTLRVMDRGETKEESVEFATKYTVKDVPPRQTATVEVECTMAKLRIPFTYKSRTTNLQGVEEIQSFHDGIFEGVTAYSVKAEISDSSTTKIVDLKRDNEGIFTF